MRILAITPISVDNDELARRQQRYDRLAPAGLSVRLANAGTGSEVPRALETAEDIAASEGVLVDRFAAADPERFDVYLPDCVLDPVVDQADRFSRPVHGIGRLAAHYLAGLGMRAGAVARNQAIATELDRKLAGYGLAAEPTAVMDLSVEDIADDALWAAAVARTVADLDCRAVINACSAVDISARPVGGPVLLDPTATALRMLGAFEELAR